VILALFNNAVSSAQLMCYEEVQLSL